MATFYAGILAELLFSLAIALIVRGVSLYRVHRDWLLAGETSPLPALETAHSAL